MNGKMRTGGAGKAHVHDRAAYDLLDDLRIDGEGTTGAAGEKDNGFAWLLIPNGGDVIQTTRDDVVPERHFWVDEDGEDAGNRVCGDKRD